MTLYIFFNTVTSSLNNKMPICALYMDLTKAFDYVDHKILLNKLEAYGIRGNALDLLTSYLVNRTQSTHITKICLKSRKEITYVSEYRVVKTGVPQGSVLGPLLFIIA